MDGTPPPQPSLADASAQIMADDSAQANATIGATTLTCPEVALNLGVFFDGTYNNAFNINQYNLGETTFSGGSYDNYHSNVYKLSRIYKDARDTIRADCGSPDTVFASVYVTGIGSVTGAADDARGAALGDGSTSGIETKLEDAFTFIRNQMAAHGGIDAIREINIDVFGFSRGAATARVFANVIAEGTIPKTAVRFMGIYDTVGSFGIPGNSVEMDTSSEIRATLRPIRCAVVLTADCLTTYNAGTTYDLNIRANSAKEVFHVVADNEYRHNFPSTRAKPGHAVEVIMPGCHGDVAGVAPPVMAYEYYERRPGPLRSIGWFDHSEAREIPIRDYLTDTDYIRPVWPLIGNASLQAMHNRASLAEVPFRSFGELERFYDLTIPGDLLMLQFSLNGGQSLPVPQRNAIAAKYAHRSHVSVLDPSDSDFSVGGLVNDIGTLVVNSAEFGFTRDIYPNQP